MVVFPEGFERYMGKAIQDLGEKVHEFDPDILLAVLRAGRLVGFAVQYYIQNLYGHRISMEYVHASTGTTFEGRKFVTVNTNDLENKKKIIKYKRIAVVDDCQSSYPRTMEKTVSYISENLSPSAIEKFCLFNDTFLIEKMGWQEWDRSDINPKHIGWHEFFSKYSGMGDFIPMIEPSGNFDLERGKYHPISDTLKEWMDSEASEARDWNIQYYQKQLKHVEEVETKMRKLIETVVMESKSKS